MGRKLARLLPELARLLGCEMVDLRLDHDPALGARRKRWRKGELIGYVPDANNPEHLVYRTALDHHIKTNVRGDGALHPDRVYIKRARRSERVRPGAQGAHRKRRSKSSGFRSATAKSKPKRKWASRPLRSVSRWPKGRKIRC